MEMRDVAARIFEEVSEAVFPSNIYCIMCGSLIDRSRIYAFCDQCVREMHWITGGTCDCCGKSLPDTYRGINSDGRRLCYDCMIQDHYFTKGWSCLSYGLHERELMMDIKYNGKGYIARMMGDVMFDRMEVLIDAGREEEDSSFPRIDVVIPVPVSAKRMVRRGYNQSELMARQFVRRWKQHLRSSAAETATENASDCSYHSCPKLEPHVLLRRKATVMLRSLNPAERRLALHGAFAVNPALRSRIEGKNILLIDDIYTTGATADACSKVRLEEGAAAVYLLTLASGGNRRPRE